jgi:LysM repeat protein
LIDFWVIFCYGYLCSKHYPIGIKERFKQFIVAHTLKAVRILIRIKPVFLRALNSISAPLKAVAKVLVFVLVPVYQLLFSIKRHLVAVYKPAKNKMMFLIANRYTVHGVIIAMVLVVGVLNLQTSIVRAEGFGERSLMYALVAEDAGRIVQEYASDDSALSVSAVEYRERTGVSMALTQMSAVLEEGTVVPEDGLYGGGALVAAPLSDTQEVSFVATDRSDIESYAVAGGDTLSSIANKYDLSINTLLWANNLSVTSVLQPGDTLTILPLDGVVHTVSSGDTIAQISYDYDIDQQTILDYNGMSSGSVLSIGNELVVPGGEKQASTRSTSSAISSLFTAPSTASAPTTISSGQATGSGYLVWPTDLRVITQYYNWRHTGLDVDCYYDNYNYASDAGYVTFSGWNGGYGYVIDVDHGNGIVTRYAHNAALYVSAGQYVSAGEAIGLCGTTGYSTGTHLHYEVIVNGVKKNPLEYIR